MLVETSIAIALLSKLLEYKPKSVDTSSQVQQILWPFLASLGFSARGVTGISEVLLTYALQLTNGRILLWTAYAASIVISIVNFLLILPLFGGTVGLGLLFPAIFLSSLLGVILALLYAVAYYLARARIVHREIPSPIMPQPP